MRIIWVRFGVHYCEENHDVLTVKIANQKLYYQQLQVFEFDSSRKRMSVIVRYPDDSIWLICKGAESHVIPQCIGGPIEDTLLHINDYAMVTLNLTIKTKRWYLILVVVLLIRIYELHSIFERVEETVYRK